MTSQFTQSKPHPTMICKASHDLHVRAHAHTCTGKHTHTHYVTSLMLSSTTLFPSYSSLTCTGPWAESPTLKTSSWSRKLFTICSFCSSPGYWQDALPRLLCSDFTMRVLISPFKIATASNSHNSLVFFTFFFLLNAYQFPIYFISYVLSLFSFLPTRMQASWGQGLSVLLTGISLVPMTVPSGAQ